jgi:dihydrofolate reductase
MKIRAILAMDIHRLIGARNGLPWHIPEDMKRFRLLTSGQVIIMGKNTYHSLPDGFRPLPNRRNIVISREGIDGVESFASIEESLDSLHSEGVQEVFVIGGAMIYNQFFEKWLIDQVDLTLIDGTYDGDIYVDEFRDQFHEIDREVFSQGSFITLVRNS